MHVLKAAVRLIGTETNMAPLLPAHGLPCNPSPHRCNLVFSSHFF